MRAVFGILGLVVVLAIVGVLVKCQLQAVASVAPAASAPGGTAAQNARRMQENVRADVVKALEAGSAARKEGADQ